MLLQARGPFGRTSWWNCARPRARLHLEETEALRNAGHVGHGKGRVEPSRQILATPREDDLGLTCTVDGPGARSASFRTAGPPRSSTCAHERSTNDQILGSPIGEGTGRLARVGGRKPIPRLGSPPSLKPYRAADDRFVRQGETGRPVPSGQPRWIWFRRAGLWCPCASTYSDSAILPCLLLPFRIPAGERGLLRCPTRLTEASIPITW